MKSSNTGLKIILVILVIVLIIGVIALVILVYNYSKDGVDGTLPEGAPAADSQIPPEMFPTNSPTKDSSKIIISEIRNNPDGSITNVSLMIPQSLVGLSAEVNGIPVVINPIDTSTIRIDIPIELNADRLEILFKAGAETRSSCILNKVDIQRTEGDCIW
ncbi:MAG: hypothetical protein AB9891_15570 [Anaerolineaceae bacterium]